MPRGRPAKPIAVLKAQGTDRKERHSKREIEPASGCCASKPADLVGEAGEFWDSEVPKFQAMGILDGVDQRELVALSKAWANWWTVQEQFENGRAKITAVATAWNTFDKIACKFGMNPVDRTKLATEKKEADDPFTEWLKAKRSLN